MKKIIFNISGVIFSTAQMLYSQACLAIENFEILPDLPDPLAYAVQPAEATTISGVTNSTTDAVSQSVGQEPSLIAVFFSLLFVIMLIYCTGIIFTKLNKIGLKTFKKQQGDLAKSQVSVVSTTQLGNNKTLHVVELDGKRMLIGASSGAIQLIKDLGSVNSNDFDEEYSHIEIPNIKIPKIEIPKIEIPTIGLSKLMTKAHKSIIDIEKSVDNSTTKESVKDNSDDENFKDQSIEDISSDEIIDSLFTKNESIAEDTQAEPIANEHVVDPDEFILYKKYLG